MHQSHSQALWNDYFVGRKIMGGIRNRGKFVDTSALKHWAKKVGITSIEKFEQRLFKVNPELSAGSKLARNAWYGSHPIDVKHLEKVSRTLELTDFACFIDGEHIESSWRDLIFSDSHNKPFIDFIDHDVIDLNLIKFEESDDDRLQEVSLNTRWHLEIQGKKGDQFLLVLQSQSEFFQLAPIKREGFNNTLTSINTRYPAEQNLGFNESSGFGWRRLIAISGRDLPILTKDSVTGYSCVVDELDVFARKLLSRGGEEFSVAVFEFVLT